MKFLIDSCISKFAVDELRRKNHDVIWIPEEKRDPGDTVILNRAFQEERILVTADKDFGDLVFVFQRPHPVIIRLVNIKAKAHGKMILEVIDKYSHELNSKPLITVEPYRIRIKHPTDK